MTTNTTKNNGLAEVIQASASHMPILLEGRLTTATIRKYDTAWKYFFSHKNILSTDQVARIINNFDSAEIANWTSNNEDTLKNGTFQEFVGKLKKKFLPHNWEDDLVQAQIATQGQTSFSKWVNDVRKANSELGAANSLYFIEENAFRCHVVPRLSPELRRSYDAHNVHVNNGTQGSLDAIMDLEAWLERINILDQDIQARHAEIQALQAKSAKMTHPAYSGANNSMHTPNQSSGLLIAAVLKLTTDERALLMAHQGCLKCRVFYAGHFADKCTVDHPSIDQCKKVTKEHAARAKASFEKNTKASTGVVVVAVFGSDSDNDSAKDGYGANEYVRTVSPTVPTPCSDIPLPSPNDSLETPCTGSPFPLHLKWSCTLDTPSGFSDSPVDTMIDCGSPPALISSTLVEQLGL